MTKERYMALADVQTLWTNTIKPAIGQTYATKNEVGTVATEEECQQAAAEITFEEPANEE